MSDKAFSRTQYITSLTRVRPASTTTATAGSAGKRSAFNAFSWELEATTHALVRTSSSSFTLVLKHPWLSARALITAAASQQVLHSRYTRVTALTMHACYCTHDTRMLHS
jgi:hypothetical protein